MKIKNFKNYLLISMPNNNNTLFFNSVIYIYQDDYSGIKGIIINKKIKHLTLKKFYKKTKITFKNKKFLNKIKKPILLGGPIEKNKGLVIHSFKKNFLSNIYSSSSISITFSKDILKYLNKKKKYKKILISLGYCFWEKYQLEKEILKNNWLLMKSNHKILFKKPIKKKWENLIKKIGIKDLNQLTIEYGSI
ncbi:YqgE/AlgH family protein [Buchnera aphidicola (Periphyllus koelreuteriae)]|uniref:YqgE/AlgH family protein n=1 Tax=Buchnera aphidicola TaxID=9 RepID=UPI0031B82CF7